LTCLAAAPASGAASAPTPTAAADEGRLIAAAEIAPQATWATMTLDQFLAKSAKSFVADPKQALGVCIGVISDDVTKIHCEGKVAPGKDSKPNASTIFGIGSNTKTLVATVLAARVAQASKLSPSKGAIVRPQIATPKLSIDQGAAALLPGYTLPEEVAGMTLGQLATHFSGLPDNCPAGVPSETEAELRHCVAGLDASSTEPPGKKWRYSNLGFGVLAHAVSTKQTSWIAYIHEGFLTPLGMGDTSETIVDPSRIAIGYDKQGKPGATAFPGGVAMIGAGGFYSTPTDMTRWLAWNMGLVPTSPPSDQILAELDKHRRATAKGFDMGLAWQLQPLPLEGSPTMVSKGGSVNAYRSYVAWLEGEKFGVVVLVNGTSKVETLASSVLSFMWMHRND
jgi:CubicO group peptidase (beta-lactamase class C family)